MIDLNFYRDRNEILDWTNSVMEFECYPWERGTVQKVLSAIYVGRDATWMGVSAIHDEDRYNSEFDLWQSTNLLIHNFKNLWS